MCVLARLFTSAFACVSAFGGGGGSEEWSRVSVRGVQAFEELPAGLEDRTREYFTATTFLLVRCCVAIVPCPTGGPAV